jgi:ribosomal protein L29
MKKKIEEFKKKSEKELKKLLAEKREALRNFRFNAKGSSVRDTKEGNTLRKDIARILGILNEKKLLTDDNSSDK